MLAAEGARVAVASRSEEHIEQAAAVFLRSYEAAYISGTTAIAVNGGLGRGI